MTLNPRFTITELHETASHKETHNRARGKWREDNPAATRYENVPTKFVAIDGEGVTLPDGTHRYALLGVGDTQIANPSGLSWEEIFEFLWEQFQVHGSKSTAYVGFFLGYDFVQWFRSMSEERARMLLTPAGRAKRQPKSSQRVQPFPVRYGKWEFDILGSKRFKLRKQGSDRWMYICDTGPFFQKSFLKVIDPAEWSEPVVSQDTFDDIAAGKQRRSSAILDDDMRRYNLLENGTLSRVLERLNSGLQSLGIHLKPNQWYGPGQAAQAWLDGRAITREELKDVTPGEALECARMSYFGGWFEIMAHGIIPGITYEYDINSAYPFVISQLPCLKHGKWTHNDRNILAYGNDLRGNNRAGYLPGTHQSRTLVYAQVEGSNPHIGAMLHRDVKGNIFRPHKTEGWYWLHEINAAKAARLIDTWDVRESWTYQPCFCPAPFAEVREIYELRKKVGKKTPLGIACKLVPNSLYGKFAQSIGSPKYANPVYASLITAGCRTIILNAIATHPKGAADVVMVATDGIYFRSPHPTLPISKELGDFDGDEKEKLCLFKPGVYWDNHARDALKNGDIPAFKARGVSARDFGKHILRIDKMFGLGTWPRLEFPVEFAMVTAVQALQRNKWELAGTIIPNPELIQSADPKGKREGIYKEYSGRGNVMITRSRPRANEPYEPSHPYEKRFGMEDPFSQESQEQWGITPDGLPTLLLKEGLSQ